MQSFAASAEMKLLQLRDLCDNLHRL